MGLMNKTLVFAIALALLLTGWLSAARREPRPEMHLVTSFDFGSYPACPAAGRGYCIQAIRLYDADSAKLLAEVPVSDTMTGGSGSSAPRLSTPSHVARTRSQSIWTAAVAGRKARAGR